MGSLPASLPLLVCLGAGLVGGVFFAFSTFVLKALAGLPAPQGIAAMQRINAVVLNPWFLGVFVGTAVLAGVGIFAGAVRHGDPAAVRLMAGSVAYLVGAFGVTAVFNVSRNERLARLDPESPAAADYWPVYCRQWGWGNHVRTLASLAAAACAGSALLP